MTEAKCVSPVVTIYSLFLRLCLSCMQCKLVHQVHYVSFAHTPGASGVIFM